MALKNQGMGDGTNRIVGGEGKAVAWLTVTRGSGFAMHKRAERGKRGTASCCHGGSIPSQKKESEGEELTDDGCDSGSRPSTKTSDGKRDTNQTQNRVRNHGISIAFKRRIGSIGWRC